MTTATSSARIGGLIGNASLLLVLAAWQLVSQTTLSGILPGPITVGTSLFWLLQEKAFLLDLLASALRVAGSLAAAMLIGGLLALLPYWVPCLNGTVHGAIKPFLNSFPAIAWALLASIWFGVSNFTVMFVQTAILIPFCLVNISEGVRLLDRDLLEMGRSFTARSNRIFTQHYNSAAAALYRQRVAVRLRRRLEDRPRR